MDKSVEKLKRWAINFVKNRDLIFKKIERIDEEEGKPQFTVYFKDKTQHCYIVAHLIDIDEISSDHVGIFTYHTKENFKAILSRWDDLSAHPNLTIYSINPFRYEENKWIIQPYHHSRIADKTSFRTGMLSMFSAVEPVREQDLKRPTD